MFFNKRTKFIFLLLGFVTLTILLSTSFKHDNKREITVEYFGETARTIGEQNKEEVSLKLVQERMYSGPITRVPWEKDPEFLKAQKEHNTPTMMAAYRTVLPNPLPGEESNVHLGAKYLRGKVLKPGEVFSQNLTIGPYSQWRGFKEGPVYLGTQMSRTTGGGVCKIASTLYNVAVLCNLPVIERHAHSMPVPYVPYGQDATVNYGAKDMKFTNNLSDPILIWSQGVDNNLYIAFYSNSKPPQVKWHHKVLKIQKAHKIYKNNWSLPEGEDKVVYPGMDGALIKSWVTIEDKNGKSEVKQMGSCWYSPMPHIVEKGCKSPSLSKQP